jgi:hypothetical protein
MAAESPEEKERRLVPSKAPICNEEKGEKRLI